MKIKTELLLYRLIFLALSDAGAFLGWSDASFAACIVSYSIFGGVTFIIEKMDGRG